MLRGCPPAGSSTPGTARRQGRGGLCPPVPWGAGAGGGGQGGRLAPGPVRAGALGRPLPSTNKQNGLCTLFTSFIVKLTPTSPAPPLLPARGAAPCANSPTRGLPQPPQTLRDPAGPGGGPGSALPPSSGVGGHRDTPTPPIPSATGKPGQAPPAAVTRADRAGGTARDTPPPQQHRPPHPPYAPVNSHPFSPPTAINISHYPSPTSRSRCPRPRVPPAPGWGRLHLPPPGKGAGSTRLRPPRSAPSPPGPGARGGSVPQKRSSLSFCRR